MYDEAGHLIGEYDASGTMIEETVYLGDMPVAVLTQSVNATGPTPVTGTNVYYICADQINTPRVITQASDNQIVWRWDATDPFGVLPPDEDPSGLGGFTYNPRFPGQLYDRETNLHYNGYRDYDPQSGRYVESDPIGLAGGLNTYSYVNNQPHKYTDSSGLNAVGGAIGGAEVGSAFGPFGTIVGSVIGAGVGARVGWEVFGPMFTKPPKNAYDPSGPKAPGKPGDAEGLKDPRRGGKLGAKSKSRNGWCELRLRRCPG